MFMVALQLLMNMCESPGGIFWSPVHRWRAGCLVQRDMALIRCTSGSDHAFTHHSSKSTSKPQPPHSVAISAQVSDIATAISGAWVVCCQPLLWSGNTSLCCPQDLVLCRYGLPFISNRTKFGLMLVALTLRGRAVGSLLAAPSSPAPAAGGEVFWCPDNSSNFSAFWLLETDLRCVVSPGVAATSAALQSCGLVSGFAHLGLSPPRFQFRLPAAMLEPDLKSAASTGGYPLSAVLCAGDCACDLGPHSGHPLLAISWVSYMFRSCWRNGEGRQGLKTKDRL